MSPAIVGLDHVQVAAPPGSEDEARRFYGAALGLEEIAKPPVLAARGGVWFRAGAHELHVGIAGDGFAPATKAHPAFRVVSVTELERIAAALSEMGVDVAWADPAELPGATRFFCHDPWGNRLELIS
jgi:catechol 2,3-dioxygenase-like lactoylglutathione lyase family enzyme